MPKTPKISIVLGKQMHRSDRFTHGRTNSVYLEHLRDYFDPICKTLATGDQSKRVRYIRAGERPITLCDIMQIGHRINREVGIFIDKKPTRNRRFTTICLFAGDKQSARGNAGATIQFPPGGPERYQIVAHYHPTNSACATQLTKDIKAASGNIEMVVNANGLIMYYNDDGCLNVKQGDCYTENLKQGDQYKFDLNTPICALTLSRLKQMRVKTTLPVFSSLNEIDSDDDPLFGDDFIFNDGSDDEDLVIG